MAHDGVACFVNPQRCAWKSGFDTALGLGERYTDLEYVNEQLAVHHLHSRQ